MQELLLFANMRNARHNLDWFMRHYRSIGVTKFFIVDNGSQDGSAEFLSDQPDVHLEKTGDDSFRAANFGVTWLNDLREQYGTQNWCLFVDSDEMLVYPGFPEVPLTVHLQKMELLGQKCMIAPMIDMFCAAAPFDTLPDQNKEPLDQFGNYCARSLRIVPSETFPYIGFRGGARTEFFGTALEDLTGKASVNLRKIPLIFSETGTEYITVHTTEVLPPSDMTGALLHFKINGHLKNTAQAEADRKEHFAGAVEYQAYARTLADTDTSLVSDATHWQGVPKLVEDGLVSCPPRWIEYLQRNGLEDDAKCYVTLPHNAKLHLWPAVAQAIMSETSF